MKKENLIAAADELNKLLFDPAEIDTKADEAEIKAAVKEASKLLEPDDELTDETIAVLQELGVWVNQEEKEEPTEDEEEDDDVEDAEEVDDEEDEDEEEMTIEEAVTAVTTLQEAKSLAKSEPEFKSLRSQLTKFKTGKELKAVMLDMLAQEMEEVEPEEIPEKIVPFAEQVQKAETLKELRTLLADAVFTEHYEKLKELKLIRALKDAMFCVIETGCMPVEKKVEDTPPVLEKKQKKEPVTENKKSEADNKTQATPKEQIIINTIQDLCTTGATLKTIVEESDKKFQKQKQTKNEYISTQRVKQMLFALEAFNILEQKRSIYVFKN